MPRLCRYDTASWNNRLIGMTEHCHADRWAYTITVNVNIAAATLSAFNYISLENVYRPSLLLY